MTAQMQYSLRVNLQNFDGEKRFADYHYFGISNEEDGYKLSIYTPAGITETQVQLRAWFNKVLV